MPNTQNSEFIAARANLESSLLESLLSGDKAKSTTLARYYVDVVFDQKITPLCSLLCDNSIPASERNNFLSLLSAENEEDVPGI